MVHRQSTAEPHSLGRLLPLDAVVWARVIGELGLAPQEARVVEGVLRGQRDKQIAQAMGIGVPTVRTYLGRAFRRCGASDRVELVVRVFTVAMGGSAIG